MKKPLLILFGGTGDLARKKLFPSLQALFDQGKLSSPVLGVGRKPFSDEEFKKFAEINDEEFSKQVFYAIADVSASPEVLIKKVEQLEKEFKTDGRIFYIALGAEVFIPTLKFLEKSSLVKGNKRIALEKPFGTDLKSAVELNKALSKIFREEEIYRVDHYLGKELVENILILRFANPLFEHLWKKENIEKVEIIMAETEGIENRADYYESAGALRDVVQNHLLQVLSLVAMDPPLKFEADQIREQKVKVMKALVPDGIVLGQYEQSVVDGKERKGYLEEKGVKPDSKTETYVELTSFVNTERWNDVPFVIKAGKGLKKRFAEVNIIFKDVVCRYFCSDQEREGKNMLKIRIQPNPGVGIRINMKMPGFQRDPVPVWISGAHAELFGSEGIEAYVRLFKELFLGELSVFPHWEEIEASWKFIDEVKKRAKSIPLLTYPVGSDGPKETFLKKR